jgi:hypothetical protein
MSITKEYLKSKKLVKIGFEIDKKVTKNAKKIDFLSEYNQWKPLKMQKLKNGNFKLTTNFPTNNGSSYQFIYKATADTGDEYVIHSDGADEYVDNGMNDGGKNAVICVK